MPLTNIYALCEPGSQTPRYIGQTTFPWVTAMLDFHPVANIFPLMTGAEYDALVSDISSVFVDCQMLGGRKRTNADHADRMPTGNEAAG